MNQQGIFIHVEKKFILGPTYRVKIYLRFEYLIMMGLNFYDSFKHFLLIKNVLIFKESFST